MCVDTNPFLLLTARNRDWTHVNVNNYMYTHMHGVSVGGSNIILVDVGGP